MVSKALSQTIIDNLTSLNSILIQILSTTSKTKQCKLIAVSKTKPVEDI